ncbi:MAG: hypothetical protein IPM74_04840 [Crocinitomicaceae bacterium]|nr:hypothetical protein [Crocinitomicaceae bacterium]MBK8925232.1 hypothetical protein [Crocinitomicaceae bacterium]
MATTIESEKVKINKNPQVVFDYLCDFNNVIHLLPQDKISDWKSTTEECSFKIQNAAVIPLVKKDTHPITKINIVSGDKAPFPFTLVVHIKQQESGCECHLHFSGEINAFLKMMVMKPLTNLFNYMAQRLQEIHT